MKKLRFFFLFIIIFYICNVNANDSHNPKFSIIVPIYNTEKYLSECIESIINQTYRNIEIILINDGSPGNADIICKKYINIDPRIKYIKQKNQGVSIARNKGIETSTGNYIFCADSDDTMEPNFIEKLYKTYKKTSCDAILIGEKFADPNIVKSTATVTTWSLSVTKDFLDKYPDVRFPEHIQPCEDGIFGHKVFVLTDKISICDNAKYFYRKHSESSEHNLSCKKIIHDIPVWYQILEEFYDKYNLWETKKGKLLTFVYNEPFSRFTRLPSNKQEEQIMFDINKNFIYKHNLDKIDDIFILPKTFYYFVKSDTLFEYHIKTCCYFIFKITKNICNQYWCKLKQIISPKRTNTT